MPSNATARAVDNSDSLFFQASLIRLFSNLKPGVTNPSDDEKLAQQVEELATRTR